jgi:hypothetical protein
MPNHALLNNVQHRDLRIITRSGADLGDNVMCALTFPGEFRSVQSCYPILFLESRDKVIAPVALFGLREGQNLFLTKDGWDARYLPLMIERQPFFIGVSDKGQVIHVDLDSPRVSRTEGVALFNEDGSNSDYLNRVSNALAAIHEGFAATPRFVDALIEHNLLEAFTLDIQYPDGNKARFGGFHTIHEDRLKKLDGAALGKLHERGFLEPLFMIVASLSKIRDLVDRASKLDPSVR